MVGDGVRSVIIPTVLEVTAQLQDRGLDLWSRFTVSDTNMYTDADNGFYNAAMAEGATAGEVWRAGFDGSFKGDYTDGPLVQLDNVDSLYIGDGTTDVAGSFVGIAAGSGLVIAVGGNIEWPYNPGEPIVYIGTGCP